MRTIQARHISKRLLIEATDTAAIVSERSKVSFFAPYVHALSEAIGTKPRRFCQTALEFVVRNQPPDSSWRGFQKRS